MRRRPIRTNAITPPLRSPTERSRKASGPIFPPTSFTQEQEVVSTKIASAGHKTQNFRLRDFLKHITDMMLRLRQLMLLLGLIVPALFEQCHAYHLGSHCGIRVGSIATQSCPSPRFRSQPALLSSAFQVFMSSEPSQEGQPGPKSTLRDKLRRATGFSFTAFRAAWRAATGISLTAIYATALAASGLWIRHITSVVLSVFPAWFRYFLQPILVAYYLPMFIIRGLTGPTRKLAKARHEAIKDSWKEAVEFAEKTEKKGYLPLRVSESGDFELVVPPKPTNDGRNDELADAVAESVEQAMERGYTPGDRVFD